MKIPKWINNIKAIGWDLDGTLYPQNSVPFKVVQQMQYQAVMKANRWTRDQAESKFTKTYANLGSHTKTLTALGVDGNNFFTNLWDELPLEEYIKHDREIINLFAQLPIKRHFLVTNSNTSNQVEKKLKLIGLPSTIFEVIITTDKLGSVKPDPKPFTEALRIMALTPSQTLFVGDRVTTDIRGANNVGMKTCLVWGKSDEADISLENVYQISKIFENV
jgi:putative hydrolase of the HAD superfamily